MVEAVRLERLARVDAWLACDGILASLQSVLGVRWVQWRSGEVMVKSGTRTKSRTSLYKC